MTTIPDSPINLKFATPAKFHQINNYLVPAAKLHYTPKKTILSKLNNVSSVAQLHSGRYTALDHITNHTEFHTNSRIAAKHWLGLHTAIAKVYERRDLVTLSLKKQKREKDTLPQVIFKNERINELLKVSKKIALSTRNLTPLSARNLGKYTEIRKNELLPAIEENDKMKDIIRKILLGKNSKNTISYL